MKNYIIYISIFLFSIIKSQNNENEIIDSLIYDTHFQKINSNYSTTLGRDSDPKLISDITKHSLSKRKLIWEVITLPGLRFIMNLLYPKSTITHFNVKNAVALTIDDGFCGIDNKNGCMVEEVSTLLKSYNAHATFFVAGSHCNNNSIQEINNLINDGNEIANHNMVDWSYKNYLIDDFEYDLLLAEKILSKYDQKRTYWYRAPFGQLSNNMQTIINKHNMVHVLTDAFAHDTFIPDPHWISKFILRKVKPGSIILIHMPERGVREWNYDALQLILEGLEKKNLAILNLSEIKLLEQNLNK